MCPLSRRERVGVRESAGKEDCPSPGARFARSDLSLRERWQKEPSANLWTSTKPSGGAFPRAASSGIIARSIQPERRNPMQVNATLEPALAATSDAAALPRQIKMSILFVK